MTWRIYYTLGELNDMYANKSILNINTQHVGYNIFDNVLRNAHILKTLQKQFIIDISKYYIF